MKKVIFLYFLLLSFLLITNSLTYANEKFYENKDIKKCPAEKLGTWIGYNIGYNHIMRIELLVGIKSAELLEDLSFYPEKHCDFSEEMIPLVPSMRVTAFNKNGNARNHKVNRYQWTVGCGVRPEVFPGIKDDAFDFIFSSTSDNTWKRFDKTASAKNMPQEVWRSLEKHIDRLFDELKEERKRYVSKSNIVLGKKVSKKVNVISGDPELFAISFVRQIIVKEKGKIYDKGSIGVSQIIDAKTFDPLAEWPIADMIHPFSENSIKDSPFLGEYGNGDLRIIIMGDYAVHGELWIVSIGQKQNVLAKISVGMEDCE